MRLVGSTQANLFASVSAGINALYGPLHGGANEAVLDMLAGIRDSGESVQKFVERVKNKEEGVKLMGFGHRVYKNFDPRAKLVKQSADEVLDALGVHDPLLDIAKELEEVALADQYFIDRKLYPNVDFYTGVIYKAMGFPTRMFTVLFAIGRLPGLDRPLARDEPRPADQDRPPAAAVRGLAGARPRRADQSGGAVISRAGAASASGSAAFFTAAGVNGHGRVLFVCQSGGLVGVVRVEGVPGRAGQVDPRALVEVGEVDDLPHRRHPVDLVADRRVPADGVHHAGAAADGLRPAVEQPLDRRDARRRRSWRSSARGCGCGPSARSPGPPPMQSCAPPPRRWSAAWANISSRSVDPELGVGPPGGVRLCSEVLHDGEPAVAAGRAVRDAGACAPNASRSRLRQKMLK